MDTLSQSLQYGEEFSVPARACIFTPGDPPEDKPVYYLVAGLVKADYRLREGRFTLWIAPDTKHEGAGRAFYVVQRGGDWFKSVLPERVLS
jgi:hypothetical protein